MCFKYRLQSTHMPIARTMLLVTLILSQIFPLHLLSPCIGTKRQFRHPLSLSLPRLLQDCIHWTSSMGCLCGSILLMWFFYILLIFPFVCHVDYIPATRFWFMRFFFSRSLSNLSRLGETSCVQNECGFLDLPTTYRKNEMYLKENFYFTLFDWFELWKLLTYIVNKCRYFNIFFQKLWNISRGMYRSFFILRI